MASNARPISNNSACTAPAGNNMLVITGNTSGTKNTFSLTVSNLFGNSQANVIVQNGYYISTNVMIIRDTSTPANSTVGGHTPNSIWFDDNYIYICLANGYIHRAAHSSF